MTSAYVLATGAVSAQGRGAVATSIGTLRCAAPTAVARDPWLAAEGLCRPMAARVSGAQSQFEERSDWLLDLAVVDLLKDLDRRRPGWRGERVGVVVGTSGGAMSRQLAAYRLVDEGAPLPRALAANANYFSPFHRLQTRLGVAPTRSAQVLVACASATVAIGLGCRWLDLDEVDLVIAGGYDALSPFIAQGFESLRATSAAPPAPFRESRDGLVLGEGAGLLALVREPNGASVGRLVGFGATADAFHPTAPEPNGRGLGEAASAALADAGMCGADVDLVSAHATATPFNDSAEAAAIRRVTGSRDPVVHPFKASIGHTLGAAGVLELLATLRALNDERLPAAPHAGLIGANSVVRVLSEVAAGTPRVALKLSAAFGGANAALVATRADDGHSAVIPRRRIPRAVRLEARGTPVQDPDVARILSVATGDVRPKRLDPICRLAVAAAAEAMIARGAPLDGVVGVVVGTAQATLDVNGAFEKRRRGGSVDPRKFPGTSPNLASGSCALAFGWRGPCMTVGGGLGAPIEALRVAVDLIRSHSADYVVVVACESSGAYALPIWQAAGWPEPEPGALAVVLGGAPAAGAGVTGCLDLMPLAALERSVSGALGGLESVRPGWPVLASALDATLATNAC